MGRPEDPIRHLFHIMKTTSGQVRACCKGCNKELSNVAVRLRLHAAECRSLRDGGLMPRKGTLPILLRKKDSIAVHRAFARVVYGCNLSFRAVGSKCFQQLVQQLAPGLYYALYCVCVFLCLFRVFPANQRSSGRCFIGTGI